MIEILPNWHPIFVHFTVALLAVATALHLLSHFMPDGGLADQWATVARWNLWFGTGVTLLTVAAGWYAFYTVGHDAPSHAAMTGHRNWAMATLTLFLGIAAWKYFLHRHGRGRSGLFTAVLVVAAAVLLSTAWRGGELVYRYGLGVMSMPKSEGQGHAHNHDVSANDGPMHDAEPEHKTPAADGAGMTSGKAGHAHAPGTPPHKD